MSKSNSKRTRPSEIVNLAELFGIEEAARYIGKQVQNPKYSVTTVKYHIYRVGDLSPTINFGRKLLFSKATLDNFIPRIKPAHRPSDPNKPKGVQR